MRCSIYPRDHSAFVCAQKLITITPVAYTLSPPSANHRALPFRVSRTPSTVLETLHIFHCWTCECRQRLVSYVRRACPLSSCTTVHCSVRDLSHALRATNKTEPEQLVRHGTARHCIALLLSMPRSCTQPTAKGSSPLLPGGRIEHSTSGDLYGPHLHRSTWCCYPPLHNVVCLFSYIPTAH